ncbi:LysR family transcriptional regulator [Klebsiella oxytoca]|uniref:LysR family transcriptional regulator n=1 Tax=Klebsiella oxytoca TaxID=571 RepID=UPI00157B1343|nr:LysR family transcriptional regulator [Klebsiella oxytoca]
MANLYGLKKFDLNLLIIFACVYRHLSISRAAETLFITPSAVSQSLQRLRNQFNDPLFIRSGKGIAPTDTATRLYARLEKNLYQLEQTLNHAGDIDLRKRFVIYSPQLFITPESSRLIRALNQFPTLQVEHHDLQLMGETVETLLSQRKADLILTLSPHASPETLCQPFQEIEMALVCRQNHPRAAEMTSAKAVRNANFTSYITNDPGVKIFHSQTKKLFPPRTIAFRSDSLMAIIDMINHSDLIGFIPKTVFEHPLFNLNLKVLPVTVPSLMTYIIYSRNRMNTQPFTSLIKTNTAKINKQQLINQPNK